MTYNSANRKDIRRQEKDARQADKDRGVVIIDLMSSRVGRAYIWNILSEAHVFGTSYSPDALAMAFAEGERNFGLRLLNDITQWCPEQFIQMMREQNDGRNSSRDDGDPGVESFPDDEDDDDSGTGRDVYG